MYVLLVMALVCEDSLVQWELLEVGLCGERVCVSEGGWEGEAVMAHRHTMVCNNGRKCSHFGIE